MRMKNLILPIRFAVGICVCLIFYFLTLSIFNLHTRPIFSLFNFVITAFGLFEVVRVYKDQKGPDFSFLNAFSVSLITGFISTIMFTFFFLFYATEISPMFLNNLLSVFKGDYNVGIGIVCFVVAVMGFATTIVLSLAFMQFFKKSYNIPAYQ